MSRLSALIIPALTDKPTPNALPMARTGSPICIALLSPQRTACSGCPVSTCKRPRSATRQAPATLAGTRVPSEKVTTISAASVTTCQLVAMRPEGSITKPEPTPAVGEAGLCSPALPAPGEPGPDGDVDHARDETADKLGLGRRHYFPRSRWTGQQRCCQHQSAGAVAKDRHDLLTCCEIPFQVQSKQPPTRDHEADQGQ